MKKALFTLSLAVMALGFSSCVCDCVGPNDQDPNNKICKTTYEDFYGPGTWGAYESSSKQSGYICK